MKGKVMRYFAANYLFNMIQEHVCMPSSSKGFVVFEFTHKVSIPNNKEEGKNVVHDLLLVMAFIRFRFCCM